MDIKEYLGQAYYIDGSIHSKLDQIGILHDLAVKARETARDAPGSSNRNIHRMENIVVKILALEEEVQKDIDALVNLKADIMHLIKRMDNQEQRTVLEQRYLCMKKWEQISTDMSYSMQHTFRLHEKALKEIARLYEKAEEDKSKDTSANKPIRLNGSL